jgi:deoxycytidylate deaminase
MMRFSKRPEKLVWLMNMAWLCSVRATCDLGRAGCVITDHNGVVLSTGYNGLATHGAKDFCGGCGGSCRALHAERNAVEHLRDLDSAWYVFITCSPCSDCAEVIAGLPNIKHVYYDHVHHRENKARQGLSILDRHGIGHSSLCVGDPFSEHDIPVT